ncbi:hypothetical protein GCM10028777_24010 [Angustibacter speluncae]
MSTVTRDDHTDARKRPDYDRLAHRDGPVPESAAWNVLSYLLAGLVGFGLPGWLLDLWLGTSWIVGVGILLGAAVSMLTIWVRYGTGGPAAGTAEEGAAGSSPANPARPDDSNDAPDASPQEETP